MISRTHRRATAVTLLASLGLAGCGPSVEGYVDDAEGRRDILARCATLEVDPTEDERCQMATEAEAVAAKRAIEGAFSGD